MRWNLKAERIVTDYKVVLELVLDEYLLGCSHIADMRLVEPHHRDNLESAQYTS